MYSNRQSAANELNNNQLQVLLTGFFGDGSLYSRQRENKKINFYYSTNSIYKEYMEYKKNLLSDLCTSKITESINQGFKKNTIYRIHSCTSSAITKIAELAPEKAISLMDDLGLALWFYDDGSLHKTKEFYNLNTQKFSREFNQDVIVPFLKNNFDITAIPTIERKQDGREFWYLRIRRFEGAFTITEILKKHFVNCFNYKLISSETIQKWSKLQEKLKSEDISIKSSRILSNLLKKIEI